MALVLVDIFAEVERISAVAYRPQLFLLVGAIDHHLLAIREHYPRNIRIGEDLGWGRYVILF